MKRYDNPADPPLFPADDVPDLASIEKAQQRLARICEPETALQDDLAVMDEAVREEVSHV